MAILSIKTANFYPLEGSSLAALATCVRNNSDSKQDRQFSVVVFTVFCTLHTSPKHYFFFSRTYPFYPCVGGLPKRYG